MLFRSYAGLSGLSVPVGSSVKVAANAQGKYEIYQLTDTGWDRVVLQDGTIQFDKKLHDFALGHYGWDAEVFDSQYWDQEPVIETRKIIQAINEQLLIGDLLLERNQCLTLMFDFMLSQFQAPGWLVKTSLIDVDHKIRELVPYQTYIRDNQDFVSQYIQEVKPYHVQVREFNLTYFGNDEYQGSLTDFDVPAYYNTDIVPNQYVSPILLPYAHSSYQPFNILSDAAADSTIWSEWPYTQWYNNFTLTVSEIRIVDGGTGYTEAPIIIIETADGDTGSGAEAIATIENGSVTSILVVDSGANYRVTPRVVFDGGNGTSARAYAVMTNPVVRQLKTVIKYDRYQYNSNIETWTSDGVYNNGTLVRYNNSVWRAVSESGNSTVTGPDFNLADWQAVPASELSGVNRSMGYYTAGVNEPGLDLHQLIPGTSYPGVQVWGDYFLGSQPNPLTVDCTSSSATNNAITCSNTLRLTLNGPIRFYGTTFGGVVEGTVYYVKEIISPTEFTLSSAINGAVLTLTTATGNMVAWVPEPIDATYASSFTDQYLGLRPTDINVDGGQFIGPYEGHAPEELVNGSEYDTVDIRVYTRPGSDWTDDGHGFQFKAINYEYDPATTTYSWAGVLEHPTEVIVANGTTGLDANVNINYTVDWDDQTITILNNFSAGDTINITVYEIGGGSQLYRANYTGLDAGDSVIVPVNATEIYEIPVFANGVLVTGVTWEPYAESTAWNIAETYSKQQVVEYSGTYYRALQTVPPGVEITNLAYWLVYVPTLQSQVNFGTTFGVNDGISLVVKGVQDPQRSWSTPQTEVFIADDAIVNTRLITLSNSLQGTNPANLVITRNGNRLRPYACIEWEGDDTSLSFGLPQRLGFNQNVINAYTDISVWVDNELQTQSFGAIVGSYSVTNWTGSNTPGRQVLFSTPPPAGSKILVSVSTQAWYTVIPGSNSINIVATVNLGDVIAVTSWNDTSEQNLATLVYVGPVITGTIVTEGFDEVPFDAATVSGEPGSFDYSEGITIANNDFYLRPGQTADRLWVTLDGLRLLEGQDFTVVNDELILASGPIATNSVMAITEFVQDVVPESMAFRIFQDMRGVQTTYRITDATSTVLAQPLSATADIVYVDDVRKLSETNLALGYFGIITINGERILYRERDIVNNAVTGLFRGTAGTGADSHPVGAAVYDMGVGNQMPDPDQNYIVSDTAVGDGSTVDFVAPSISQADFGDSSSIFHEAVEVYVGGIRSRIGYNVSNIVVGTEYTIASIGDTDWYSIGLPADEFPAPGVVFTATDVGTGTGVVGESFSSNYYTITMDSPVTITFTTADDLPAPADGVEVTILERRGVNWYQPGVGTASDGRPLQITETTQARFLRGL